MAKVKVDCSLTGLDSLDSGVFLEVVEFVILNGRGDLHNLSLTCKSVRRLTRPFIFQSIRLPLWTKSNGGSDQRLYMYDRSEWDCICTNIGPYVRNLGFRWYLNTYKKSPWHCQKSPNLLSKPNLEDFGGDDVARTISGFPNLRTFAWIMYEDIPQIILDSLGRHQAKPMLHVVDENCIQLDRLCGSKCLEALDFRLYSSPRMTKEPILAVQEVVMSCPNLRSLTLSNHTHHDGCVLSPLDDVLTQFSTKLKGKFPPLEELKLDDYDISDEEWPYWSDNLQWQCLWNLSLMSSSVEPILPKLIGRVQNLRKLELMRYPHQIEYSGQFDDNVDRVLRSFSSLEIIIFEGYSASVEALMRHRNLSDLHMHTAESRYSGEIRPVLSAEDLQLLSQNCPKIKDLYIDVYRNGSWPYEIFVALGRGFPYLENLFVHFELGICDTSAPIQPVLKHESAKRLFRRFWVEKKTNLLAQFSSLTFIVGQIRPRFSAWLCRHAAWEYNSAADIQIRPKMSNRPAPKRPKTRSKKSYSDLSKPLFSAQGHRVYWHSPECTIFAGGRVVTDTADGADLELYRMDLNYNVFEKGTCPEAVGRYHHSVLAGLDGVRADKEADNVVAVRPIGRLPSEPSDPTD